MTPSLQNIIAHKLGLAGNSLHFMEVGGGCINQTYQLADSGTRYFCKINSASKFPHLFRKEEKALKFIASQNRIKVPEVVSQIEAGDDQVLVLEWIDQGPQTEKFWKTFGRQLAELHFVSNASFGWQEDNYMGSVVQQNTWTKNWTGFFAEKRLQPLVIMCMQEKLLNRKHLSQFENIYQKLDEIFSPEPPSLLHGDLWSGNFMCNGKEEPVLIDPALYFGHRSADLAMTTLFGGFSRSFYEAYHYHFPLPANYSHQWKICNLYPLLIHLFLFHSGYRQQIERILNEFET